MKRLFRHALPAILVLSVFGLLYASNVFNVKAQTNSILKSLFLSSNESGEITCDGKMSFVVDHNNPSKLVVECDPKPTASPQVQGDTVHNSGGLTGTYFHNKDFTNFALQRLDSTVNFSWGGASPDTTVGPNTFLVIWTGFVHAPYSGEYTFYTKSDDGIKLWINNQLVVSNWTDHSETENSGKISLDADKWYQVTMQFYENHGGAVAKLLWAHAQIQKQVVPSEHLAPEGTHEVNSSPSPTATAAPTHSHEPSASPAPTATPQNGNAPSGGLGVGSGGLEVGINLAKFNQIKTDAATGMYDRLCTTAEHDKTKWHTLVNEQAKCHYDHHHGDDPNYVSDIFGEPGSWFQSSGQSISYPWQTFALPATATRQEAIAQSGTPGQKENDLKHEGYFWVVRRNQPCDDKGYCVKDFRVQYHFHGTMDAAVKMHSMSAEIRACKDVNDPSTCGIVRTGGWVDHGQLLVMPSDKQCWNERNSNDDHTKFVVPLPNDHQFGIGNFNLLIDEFRCHKELTASEVAKGPKYTGGSAPTEWWIHGASDFRFQLLVFDPMSNVIKNSDGTINTTTYFCGKDQANCAWNQSVASLRIAYILPVNSYFVQGGYVQNGKAMLPLGKRYLSRFGGINDSCTAPGLDCVPIEYNNLPLSVDPGKGLAGFTHKACDNNSCPRVDHDITPAGKASWINWFQNHH